MKGIINGYKLQDNFIGEGESCWLQVEFLSVFFSSPPFLSWETLSNILRPFTEAQKAQKDKPG